MNRLIVKIFYNLFWIPIKLILNLFVRIEIETKQDLKKLKGPLIVVSNHGSCLDPFLIGTAFPFNAKIYPIRYAVLNKIFYFPLALPFMWAVGSFPVKRGIGLKKALKSAKKILENKGVVGMFPQGRRQRAGKELLRPKRGIAYIAFATGAKLVPIKIEGHIGIKLSKFLLRKHKIKIKIGKTFNLSPRTISTIDDYNEPANYVMQKIIQL